MRSRPQETIAEAWSLQKQGIGATNAGQPSEGADYLRAGLALLGWDEAETFVGSPEATAVVARLIISLAYAEAELGRTPHGLELLDLAELYAAPDQTGLLLTQRGLLQWRSGNKMAALDCLTEAEPLLSSFATPNALGQMLLNKGAVLGDLGRYNDARKELNRCAELAQQHKFTMLSAKALHSQGLVARCLGDVPAALALYAEAEDIYESVAPDMAPLLAISTAAALRSAGLKSEAATRLDNAIQVLGEQRRVRTLLTSEVHRARIALDTADPQAAASLAERARLRARDLGSESLADWAEQVRRDAEFQLGNSNEEFARQTLALAKRQRAMQQADIAELAEMLAARAFIRAGRLRRAEWILLRRPRVSSAHVQVANLTRRLARAELAIARNDKRVALRELRTGLAGLHHHRERFGSLELQTGVTSMGAALTERGLGLALDSGRPTTVFSWSERSRAQAYRLPSVTPIEDTETADRMAQVRTLRDTIREAEQEGRGVPEERTRVRKLERQLQERSWQAAGPGDSVPEVRAKQVHESLADTKNALVSFLSHGQRLHALTLISGRSKLYTLGPISEVDESVRRVLADLNALTGRKLPSRMATVVQASVRHLSNQLDTLLFSQFRSQLADRELVIVPTGLLSALPWGLLPGLHGRPVAVSPSAAEWLAAVKRPDDGPGQPLLVSGPDLINAQTELDAIARCYRRPSVLQGAEATPSAILSALDGAPIAHLAAHGYHEPDNVQFSRLDFADGPLMAHDIARLEIPPAHVTLSACDVGQSKVAVGDETLGFTAALLYAGTRTVVSSMTKVEHSTAADIMTAYHRKVVGGLPPATALAEASAQYEFSPFVCYGAGNTATAS